MIFHDKTRDADKAVTIVAGVLLYVAVLIFLGLALKGVIGSLR